jgi:hypothetical protein
MCQAFATARLWCRRVLFAFLRVSIRFQSAGTACPRCLPAFFVVEWFFFKYPAVVLKMYQIIICGD